VENNIWVYNGIKWIFIYEKLIKLGKLRKHRRASKKENI